MTQTRAFTSAATQDLSYDADLVIYRLEEAGASLLALPSTGWTTKLRSSSLEIVRTTLEAYGWTPARIKPPVPSSEKISRMDEAMGWLALIRQSKKAIAPSRIGEPVSASCHATSQKR